MDSTNICRASLVLAIVLSLVVATRAAEEPSRAVQQDQATVSDAMAAADRAYRQQLIGLAQQLTQQKLTDEAAIVRAWSVEREPGKTYVWTLPDSLQPPGIDARSQTEASAAWWTRFVELRKQQAELLFTLSGQAIRERQPGLAYELVQSACRENPDHAAARRILGYEKVGSRWVTPFAAKKLADGFVWHEKFGWLLAADVRKYESGLRKNGVRWVSAEEDARLHRSIKTPWKLETEHYIIHTNHSLEEAVVLGQRLEKLYAAWRQIFVAYYATPAELKQVFEEGKAWKRERRPHQVVYFRERDEYNQTLKPSLPQIASTLGIYFDRGRTAYFFADDEQYEGTLYHEATHQLFQESRTTPPGAGRRDNFWIIEAIACYMESLTDGDGYITLGGLEEGRAPAARKRLLEDNFYVPLAELVTFGMEVLQRDRRLPMIYSQSSGLAAFLMHYDSNRYRPALLRYLEAVYAGKAKPDTLAELTGASYEQLDREYREFLQGKK